MKITARPVGYRHVMRDADGTYCTQAYTKYGAQPWGVRGRSFSPNARITSEPLYTRSQVERMIKAQTR